MMPESTEGFVRVWRIEHRETRQGPYYHNPRPDGFDPTRIAAITRIPVGQPESPDEVHGLPCCPDLGEDERAMLRAAGFRLLSYALPASRVRFGDRQAYFRQTDGTITEETPL